MYRFGKACLYIFISVIISIGVYYGDNTFFDSFLNGLIPVLATLSALYMTVSSIIAVEMNKLTERHPGINITNTMYSVKRIFIVQLVLIAALFISFIVRDILIKIEFEITCFHDIVIIFSNAFAIAVFLYFLEALYDVGQTVYSLIDYNGSNNNK